MKPAQFDYYAPTSVEEALGLLADLGYGVKILAGGQSLVPAMNFRMALPPALLDLNNITELAYIRPTQDGIAIGTMTRDSDVEHDPEVIKRFPIIKEAMHHIAHPQIRNRGTFGGAIAHADPTGQLPAVCLALQARYLVSSKNGQRWVESDDFFIGPFTTVIEPEEMLVEVFLPNMAPHSGASYQQTARQAGAQALVGAAAVVELDDAGLCENVRLAYLSVGETPLLALHAAKELVGKAPTPDTIAKAAATAAAEDVDPGGDIHCSVEFRRHLVEVIGCRALTAAFAQAQQ